MKNINIYGIGWISTIMMGNTIEDGILDRDCKINNPKEPVLQQSLSLDDKDKYHIGARVKFTDTVDKSERSRGGITFNYYGEVINYNEGKYDKKVLTIDCQGIIVNVDIDDLEINHGVNIDVRLEHIVVNEEGMNHKYEYTNGKIYDYGEAFIFIDKTNGKEYNINCEFDKFMSGNEVELDGTDSLISRWNINN